MFDFVCTKNVQNFVPYYKILFHNELADNVAWKSFKTNKSRVTNHHHCYIAYSHGLASFKIFLYSTRAYK